MKKVLGKEVNFYCPVCHSKTKKKRFSKRKSYCNNEECKYFIKSYKIK